MLQRLYGLYSKAPENPSVTPTERFVTEALVGLLESDLELKLNFLKKVCCVDFTNAEIDTEASYDGGKSYIDIQIQNKSQILFIEVKVDSGEGKNQLKRYHELLQRLCGQKKLLNSHLIYLTRDYVESPDYFSTELFSHIYWSQIGDFFSGYRKKNNLVDSFLKFLDNLRLGPMKPINEDDLEVLSNYVSIEDKIQAIIGVMRSVFKKKYGKPSFANQIIENERIILYRRPVLGEDGYSELGLGLYFDKRPYIRAHIFVGNSNDYYKKFETYIKNMWTDKEFDIYLNSGISIGFKKNLDVLVNDKSPRDKLENVVKELFNNLNQVTQDTSNLKWLISNT